MQADIALIGLAVMGQNLVINMADHGFTVAVFNRTFSVVDEFVTGPARGMSILGTRSLDKLVGLLKRPRRVMMLVKAGQPVDDFIEKLIPLLEPGDSASSADIIIDGGNSNFKDTIRQTAHIESKGLLYVGTGGCVIRAAFLDDIRDAYVADPALPSLLLAPYFRDALLPAAAPWRRVVAAAVELGIPVPAMSSALAFFDGYRRDRLPANLIQAQRDYFGAHTYERVDALRGEFFHTNWTGHGGDVTARTYQA
jgi:6-phosphogluconate dehydrogenase